VAVQPVETEFGRKRRIDQSTCNKDFSCLKGFCPSFVTVEGGELIKGTGGPALDLAKIPFPHVPEAEMPALDKPWSILVTGIGGTGVVTIGHILGMAAFIEGKGSALIDMVGISQKNGAVVTHLKIAARPEDIQAVRVARGSADLILGCDLVTSASERILAAASRRKTQAVVNSHETMPAHFTHDADFDLQGGALTLKIAASVKPGGLHVIDAGDIATKLLGDSIAANLFTLGYAWQKGLVPVSREAIEEAVTLNGAAVKMNLAAFAWGRRAAVDEQAVRAVIGAKTEKPAETLEEIVSRRVAVLTDYQDAAYAESYASFITKVRAVSKPLALAVAKNLFRLMAYKDEYEVARLHSGGSFEAEVARQFKGDYKLTFHLAPPILGRKDASGRPVKTEFGSWMMTAFRMLAKLKRLRGTAFDVFGRTAERRMERQLIADYCALIERLLSNPQQARSKIALDIAALPEQMRGFGHVKEANVTKAKAREKELLSQLSGNTPAREAAE
jgi:indolepyruvate ferredoxin oxidoreductase